MVLRVAGNDAFARKRPVVFLANGDDLARVARAEVVERVVPGHAGDAGDEQRQRKRFVGARNHTHIVAKLQAQDDGCWSSACPAAGHEGRVVGRRIDSAGRVRDNAHQDCAARLQHAELLELFGLLER